MVEGRPGSAPSQPSQGHLLQGTFPLEATLPWASSAPLCAPPAAAPQPQPPCPCRLLLQSARLSGEATRTPRAPAVSLSLGQCPPRNHMGPGLMWRFQGEWGPNQPQQRRGDEERPCQTHKSPMALSAWIPAPAGSEPASPLPPTQPPSLNNQKQGSNSQPPDSLLSSPVGLGPTSSCVFRTPRPYSS